MASAALSMKSFDGTATAPALHADLAHISFDSRLTSKIMAKRADEMARRTRLLDPRKRALGVSHDVLDAQLMEKRALAEQEVEEEEYYAKATLLQEQVAQACENIKASAARDRHKKAVEYSLQNLRKEDRREYALSDPNELKKERVLTDEEMKAYGPSSMMSLGERPEDRLRMIKEAQSATRDWLQEQMREKAERHAAERELDRKWDKETLFANHIRAACEQAEQEDARQERLETQADNFRIAEEHAKRRQAKLEAEIMRNKHQVDSIMTDQRLAETHPYTVGGNGRVIEFRRPSSADKRECLFTNAKMIIRKHKDKRVEHEMEQEHGDQIKQGVAVLSAVEKEKERMTIERRLAAEDHNKGLAATKKKNDLLEMRNYRSFTHLG